MPSERRSGSRRRPRARSCRRAYTPSTTHPCLSRCDPPSFPGQEPVLKISTVVADGLHSPLTKHGGWPIVDGVATSYNSAAVVARNKYLVPLVESVCPSLGRLVVAAVNPKPMHYNRWAR